MWCVVLVRYKISKYVKLYAECRLTDEMIIHLVVPGDVFDGVLFCVVPFPRGILDKIWD